MVTIDDVRELALSLPRTTEGIVRDEVRFRIGRIVYLGFSRDETSMGFAFPKEERDALVASDPTKFRLPRRSELRYNWVVVRLDAIDAAEMRELVVDTWRMVVPKRVAAEHLGRLIAALLARELAEVARERASRAPVAGPRHTTAPALQDHGVVGELERALDVLLDRARS